MRKLMLFAVAALATAVTQAASVGWTLAGAKDYAGDAYQIFVIGQNGVENTTQITAILEAGESSDSYAFGSGTIGSNGAVSKLYTATGQPTLEGGSTYTAFFVVFDAATSGAANNYALVSGQSTLTQSPSATSAGFNFVGGNVSSILNDSSNWKATPEPTSVALLLLGAAAFSLKRKRA